VAAHFVFQEGRTSYAPGGGFCSNLSSGRKVRLSFVLWKRNIFGFVKVVA
jgi:hypothetical protein